MANDLYFLYKSMQELSGNKRMLSEFDTIYQIVLPMLKALIPDSCVLLAPKKNRWDVQLGATIEAACKEPLLSVECKPFGAMLRLRRCNLSKESRWSVKSKYLSGLSSNSSKPTLKGFPSAEGDDLLQVWMYGYDKRYRSNNSKWRRLWTNGIDWYCFKAEFFKTDVTVVVDGVGRKMMPDTRLFKEIDFGAVLENSDTGFDKWKELFAELENILTSDDWDRSV